jgi:hypothetical protein
LGGVLRRDDEVGRVSLVGREDAEQVWKASA